MEALQEDDPLSLEELSEEVLVRVCSFLPPGDLASLGPLHSTFRRIILLEAFKRGFQWARWRFLDRALSYFACVLHLNRNHAPTYEERAIARFNMG